MNQAKINQIFMIVLVLLLVMVVITFVFALRDGNTCIANPLTYGAEKLSTEETGDVFCSCGFSNPKYNRFIFDKHNVSVIE